MLYSYIEEYLTILFTVFLGCWTEQAPQILPPDLPNRFVNSVGMEMQFVPAGTFTMGSDEDFGFDGIELRPFAPAHEVSVDAFYMARFELTVAQFEEFAYETGIADQNPDYNPELDHIYGFPSGNPAHPIQSIDWYTARDFCVWLSEREGIEYRLPREAEWEYVATAGGQQSKIFTEEGNFFRSFENCVPTGHTPFLGIAPVGSFAMNPWGFYDLLGNAPEWVMDWYSYNYDSYDCAHNPDGPWWGPLLRGYKIRRGGMFQPNKLSLNSCLPEFRIPALAHDKYGTIRLVCPIDSNFIPYSSDEPKKKDLSSQLVLDLEPNRIYENWDLSPNVELKMVWIEPGEFLLGTSADSAEGRASHLEQPRAPAVFSSGFYMGVFEVTNIQYRIIIEDHAFLVGKENFPVEGVTFSEAINFTKTLTKTLQEQAMIPEGAFFDIPKETEWEYACRAGSSSDFSFGDDPIFLDDYAWFDHVVGAQFVGQKRPNRWGLYDMSGNVMEICKGGLNQNYEVFFMRNRPMPTLNPDTGRGGPITILRGGSWAMMGHRARSSARHTTNASQAFPLAGFRLIRRLGPNEVPPTPNIDPETITTYPADEYPWDELHPRISRY